MWKPIIWKNIDSGYKISKYGHILNKRGTGYMAQHENSGYMRVRLYIDKSYKFISVHRLVAEAFIPNSENLIYINHKDKNRSNNNIENLEWISARNNIKHSYRDNRKTNGRMIIQIDLQGTITNIFNSIQEASKYFENHRTTANGISKCARGKLQQYKGYIWIYGTSIDSVDKMCKSKLIPGFEGYKAYSNGKVKAKKLDRFLKSSGYPYKKVILFKDGKRYIKYVHRLIAITFLNNPMNKKYVNHKNGLKADNRVENLEWMTPSENAIHAFDKDLNPTRRKVSQYTIDNIFLRSHNSLRNAQRYMGKSPNSTAILYACQGRSKHAYGYVWKYVDI